MANRILQHVRDAPHARLDARLASREIHEALGDAELDPFLVVSLFDMSGPVFPPHPHAGFSVATYLLPESPVGFINQDSLGTRNEIAPGGLHATVAGSGVLHEEQPVRTGGLARGYQIWIDHRNGARAVAPRPETLEAADVPVRSADGATVRVLIGASNGLRSPVTLPTPVRLVDVALEAGATFADAGTADEQGFIVLVAGGVTAGATTVRAGEVAVFPTGGERLELVATAPGTRLTLFAGVPLRQPRVLGGPVVGGSRAEVEGFRRAAARGDFGTLRPFAAG